MLSCVLSASLLALPLHVTAASDELNVSVVKHVLLISVDGLHGLDLTNYVASHHDSTLASLWSPDNSTSQPSDSFPGLASLIIGGSPITTGFWYDVTYNRAISPPTQTTPFPIIGGKDLCPNVVGTQVAYDESVDVMLTQLNGGGGIDPNFLPHEYVRVNTIFEGVKAHGGRTAWIDKHPSYELKDQGL
jgi:Type I phosphodiesterase / nucleotide pyrophosphatase